MKTIVITGATSFIGIHLIREWLRHDVSIYAVVRPGSHNMERIPKDSRIHIVEQKMDEYHLLSDQIGAADCFYHLAWEGARAPYRDDEVLQRKNYDGAVKAMSAAVKMQCKFFLGTGSQAEYSADSKTMKEEDECNPNTAYGKEKLHACMTLRDMAEDADMNFIWLRVFSIYGTYDYEKTLVMSALEKMKDNLPIEMTAATQLWDYLYVEDLAKAMVLFADKNCPNGVYNIASGQYKPLNEFVTTMKNVMGSNSELKFGSVPYGPKGPVNLTPNIGKIQKALGWSPSTTFEDGIAKMIVSIQETNPK
ncbi:MAG: NAD(P)-dependent oxidoreductase [Lachnospiraceae bacterium]|nr:NAD(P)-dependent oxidoreductase [Lachnospiraceae bacterium]